MVFRMVYKSGQIFLPFCHNPRVWQTDRKLLAIPRLHYMQRGKNRLAFRRVTGKNKVAPFFRTRCIFLLHASVSFIKPHNFGRSVLKTPRNVWKFCGAQRLESCGGHLVFL